MADQLVFPSFFPWNPQKKTKKSAGLSAASQLAAKPVIVLAGAILAGNERLAISLPLVRTTDQKMNGTGFFRSEYATDDTGSAPSPDPRSGS
jgi:hypothetical protein